MYQCGGAERGALCQNVKKKITEMSEMSKKKLKCRRTLGNVYET